jgi:formylmethanofuran dehydrogenase subunit B
LSEGDDLILDLLVRLVAKRNETSRAAVLPLAGSNGDTTAQQVCTWKTGFPLRQAIQQHSSDYQPHRFRALDVLKRQDCDAAIYVSAFEPIEPPEEFWGVSGVKVVVGHPALKCATRADYFFPSGIPGVDHESHLFRGDGVTIISVDRKRDSLAPPVAEWFGKLLNQDKDAAFSQSYPQV